MGVSRTFAELAGKLDRAAGAVGATPVAATSAVALMYKRKIEDRLGTKRLRGVGKRGSNVGVRYIVGTSVSEANAVIFATGPFQLIERDTKPHRIPRQRSARSRKRARVVVIPGYGPRQFANHPGTQGRHPFEKGAEDALPLVGPTYMRGVNSALSAIF